METSRTTAVKQIINSNLPGDAMRYLVSFENGTECSLDTASGGYAAYMLPVGSIFVINRYQVTGLVRSIECIRIF